MGLFGGRAHPLVGAWKLVSAEFELAGGEKAGDVFGPQPRGWLLLTADGRLMAILGASDAGELMSYTGAWRLEGEGRFVTRVDMAWRADWVGTDQGRNFRIEGDELFIVSDVQPHPLLDEVGRGVLRWRRHRGS
jgi:hypothetical protein